jgi:hypothetical protein
MRLRIASPVPAPDLILPVIGFRQWRLRDGRLHSLMTDDEWTLGALDARCRGSSHPSSERDLLPSGRCSCGIYAYYRPLPRTASVIWPELVAGAVALWGELQAHATGLRAEHAQAVVFAVPMGRGRKRRELLSLAEELGVDVVSARHLRSAAAVHGGPLPHELKPVPDPVGVAAALRWGAQRHPLMRSHLDRSEGH